MAIRQIDVPRFKKYICKGGEQFYFVGNIINSRVVHILMEFFRFAVPKEWDTPHAGGLTESTSLSYIKGPEMTYSPRILSTTGDLTKQLETLGGNAPLSGPQVEFLIRCCQRMSEPMVNGFQPGFLLGNFH